MIAALRKRHFRIWIGIVVLLPAGVIAAYVMTSRFPVEEFSGNTTRFPELLRSAVSENYMFSIKKNYAGGTVLEVMQISRINPASELVTIEYTKNFSKNKTKKVLGMMAGDKTYLFYLKDVPLPFSIEVKDTIKNQVLASITF